MAGLVSSALSGLTGAGNPINPQASGLQILKSYILKEFSIGQWGLLFLSGFPPIAPISSLGNMGINLIVGGSLVGGAAKAGLSAMLPIFRSMLDQYAPGLWPYKYLLAYSPWLLFDFLQIFKPSFLDRVDPTTGQSMPGVGFCDPLFYKPIAAKGGKATLTMAHISMVLFLLSSSFYYVIKQLPDSVMAGAKPVLNLVSFLIGSLSILSAGGIGAVMAFPNLISQAQGVFGEVKTAFAPAAAPAAPTGPAVAAAAPATAATTTGPAPLVAPVTVNSLLSGSAAPAPAPALEGVNALPPLPNNTLNTLNTTTGPLLNITASAPNLTLPEPNLGLNAPLPNVTGPLLNNSTAAATNSTAAATNSTAAATNSTAAATNSTAAATNSTAAATAPASNVQTGGKGMGSVMPNLREIADGMLGPSPYGDPAAYYSRILSGGGIGTAADTPSVSSVVFLGSLALLGLGGIAAARIRARQGV